MRIDVHDVGHGHCAVITCPNGVRFMLDCGRDNERPWAPSSHYRGEFIDGLVLQNMDEDHVEDLPNLPGNVRIGGLYTNPTVTAAGLAYMKSEHGMGPGVRHVHAILTRYWPGAIGAIPIAETGGVEVWAHFNRYGLDFSDSTNNLSLAVFVRYGAFTMLFAGDLEKAGWLRLLEQPLFRYFLASVNVLVASHHGRFNGQCEEAFKVFKPYVVIFSDCERVYDSQNTDAWYRRRTTGIPDLRTVDPLTDCEHRHVLTTRRDGTLAIDVDPSGHFLITPTRVRKALPPPPLSPLALALLGRGAI